MSPRRLDPGVVDSKLRLMEPLVAELRAIGTPSAQELEDDFRLRLAAERAMTLLVDLAVGVNGHAVRGAGAQVPQTYADSFTALARVGGITSDLARRLVPSAGMRNVLTHRYGEIDLDRVADAIPRAVADYTDYVRQVSAWLLERPTT